MNATLLPADETSIQPARDKGLIIEEWDIMLAKWPKK